MFVKIPFFFVSRLTLWFLILQIQVIMHYTNKVSLQL